MDLEKNGHLEISKRLPLTVLKVFRISLMQAF